MRVSICTGERTAGFQDRQGGAFVEVMQVRNDRELAAFCTEYGVTPQHTGIKVKYELIASSPDAMGGLATQKQVLFTFKGKNGNTHQALLLLYIPNIPTFTSSNCINVYFPLFFLS